MSDLGLIGLMLSAGFALFFTVQAESKSEDLTFLAMSSLGWWCFAFFWLIVISEYWWMFILPLTVGLVYFVRLLSRLVDLNRVQQAITRFSG
ncbi:MAG: hypothetical protein QXQ50_04545 [Candidatus Bathyarchaeia archaeon]